MSKKVTKKQLAQGSRPTSIWQRNLPDKPAWKVEAFDGERHADLLRRDAENRDRFRMFIFNRLDEKIGLLLPSMGLAAGPSSLLEEAPPVDKRKKRKIDKIYAYPELAGRLPMLIREVFVEYWDRSEKGPIDTYTLASEYTTHWWDGPPFTADQIRNREKQRLTRRHSVPN